MKPQAITLLALLSCGCLLDSVEPWLSPETIVEANLEVDGSWTVVDEVALFGSESSITLERKPVSAKANEYFYIKITPKKRDTQFVFEATLHEIDGLRFLQISNFTHFDGDIFSLANRPTYSLWRIEADGDNIMIWMPELGRGAGGGLKTLRDQDDKMLFVDTASNNEAAVRAWVEATRSSKERPKRALGLALTRTGTEFVMPAAVQEHLPTVYEDARRARGRASTEPSS